MGIVKRQVVLFALTGIGGGALLLDKTMLTQATGAVGSISGMVEQVKAAQSIAQTLDSGDPAAIQNLLETLVENDGADPNNVTGGLFGSDAGDDGSDAALAGFSGLTGLLSPEDPEQAPPEQAGDRVSMIIATAGGGLAVVNGKPMRAGQSVDGVKLVEVLPDHVVIEREGAKLTLSLR